MLPLLKRSGSSCCFLPFSCKATFSSSHRITRKGSLAVCTQELPRFRKGPSKGFFLQMHCRTPTIRRRYYSSSIAMFIWQLMAALSTYLVNSAKYSVFTCVRGSHAASVAWTPRGGSCKATRLFVINFGRQQLHRQLSLTHCVFGT